MLTNLWWLWMVMAALFVVGEIFTGGFFILWFGIGAAVAGVLALLGLDAIWQWGAFVAVSGSLIPLSKRFAQAVTDKQPSGIGADRNIGQQAVVTEEIDNDSGSGQVSTNGEQWRAKSVSGEKIAKGAKVTVTAQEGTQLLVTKITEGEKNE
jgi:inner membrane protein